MAGQGYTSLCSSVLEYHIELVLWIKQQCSCTPLLVFKEPASGQDFTESDTNWWAKVRLSVEAVVLATTCISSALQLGILEMRRSTVFQLSIDHGKAHR